MSPLRSTAVNVLAALSLPRGASERTTAPDRPTPAGQTEEAEESSERGAVQEGTVDVPPDTADLDLVQVIRDHEGHMYLGQLASRSNLPEDVITRLVHQYEAKGEIVRAKVIGEASPNLVCLPDSVPGVATVHARKASPA